MVIQKVLPVFQTFQRHNLVSLYVLQTFFNFLISRVVVLVFTESGTYLNGRTFEKISTNLKI